MSGGGMYQGYLGRNSSLNLSHFNLELTKHIKTANSTALWLVLIDSGCLQEETLLNMKLSPLSLSCREERKYSAESEENHSIILSS